MACSELLLMDSLLVLHVICSDFYVPNNHICDNHGYWINMKIKIILVIFAFSCLNLKTYVYPPISSDIFISIPLIYSRVFMGFLSNAGAEK